MRRPSSRSTASARRGRSVSRRSTPAALPALGPAGEELLTLAERAGLDEELREDLRRSLEIWSRRYRQRRRGLTHGEDAALIALTVHYLRRLREEG